MYFVVSIHCFFLPCKPYPPNVAVIVDSPPIFGYNEAILTKEDETMNHTMPDSPAKYAVIKRARFLTDVRWTPLAEIPSHKQPDDSRRFPAGVTVTGMPYSSVEVVDKFIGENVSFGTFLSAVANPDSVLYTRDLSSFKNASGYYGCVCNELVRYALGIPQRYNTRHWYEIPGMHKVLEHGAYSADELQLCDVLHEYDSIHTHVALVTDLLRDKDGKVVMIEISEATIPSCKRHTFTVEEYFKLYGTYDICRWDGTESAVMWDPADEVTLFARDAAVNPRSDIAHCYGDGANILSGEEVVISVFTEDPCNAEIYRDGALIEKIFFKGPGKASRTFERGDYVLRHSVTGQSTRLRVNDPAIHFIAQDGVLTVKVDSGDPGSQLVHMDFRGEGEQVAYLERIEHLTPEERAFGVFSRPIPDGAHTIKFFFRNAFGLWASRLIQLDNQDGQ